MSVLNRFSSEEINNLYKVNKEKITFTFSKLTTDNHLFIYPLKKEDGLLPFLYYIISNASSFTCGLPNIGKYIEDYAFYYYCRNRAGFFTGTVMNKDYYEKINQPNILKELRDVIFKDCFLHGDDDDSDDEYYENLNTEIGNVYLKFKILLSCFKACPKNINFIDIYRPNYYFPVDAFLTELGEINDLEQREPIEPVEPEYREGEEYHELYHQLNLESTEETVNNTVNEFTEFDFNSFWDGNTENFVNGTFDITYGPLGIEEITLKNRKEVNQNKNKTFKSEQCVICTEKQPNILFCSCGHLCMCNTCFIAYDKDQCPICKSVNTNIREI